MHHLLRRMLILLCLTLCTHEALAADAVIDVATGKLPLQGVSVNGKTYSVTLQLTDPAAQTLIVDQTSVAEARTGADITAMLHSSTGRLFIPRLKFDTQVYSLALKLIDAEHLVFQPDSSTIELLPTDPDESYVTSMLAVGAIKMPQWNEVVMPLPGKFLTYRILGDSKAEVAELFPADQSRVVISIEKIKDASFLLEFTINGKCSLRGEFLLNLAAGAEILDIPAGPTYSVSGRDLYFFCPNNFTGLTSGFSNDARKWSVLAGRVKGVFTVNAQVATDPVYGSGTISFAMHGTGVVPVTLPQGNGLSKMDSEMEISVQTVLSVEVRRDANLYVSGTRVNTEPKVETGKACELWGACPTPTPAPTPVVPANPGGNNDGGSAGGGLNLLCPGTLPAGYQCLSNAGQLAPGLFNNPVIWGTWIERSAGVCMTLSSTGASEFKYKKGIGASAGLTSTGRWGALVSNTGQLQPGSSAYYVFTGSTDPQIKLLTFNGTGFVGWQFARASVLDCISL